MIYNAGMNKEKKKKSAPASQILFQLRPYLHTCFGDV